jgi:hypothetical protein
VICDSDRECLSYYTSTINFAIDKSPAFLKQLIENTSDPVSVTVSAYATTSQGTYPLFDAVVNPNTSNLGSFAIAFNSGTVVGYFVTSIPAIVTVNSTEIL